MIGMSLCENNAPAYLMLADGTVFKGKSFGASGTTIGEVVFTTSMGGYQEILTDPCHYGQIVIQTFPIIGNYGINDEDSESSRTHLNGYIVREYCDTPSNFRSSDDIDSYLKKENVVSICGIDTRRLTRAIREKGVMNGAITTENLDETAREKLFKKINSFSIKGAVQSTSSKTGAEFAVPNAKYNVVMIDYGFKRSICNELTSLGCNIKVVPSYSTVEEILSLNPDGILLSTGGGDPSENGVEIEVLKQLIPYKIPTFGICLGHQLLAIANGAKVIKQENGHRGSNQPVCDISLGRTFVTSQNHGYIVDIDSVDDAVARISHVNGNDGTCEGIEYLNMPAFSVQFHPNSNGGSQGTSYLYDRFIKLMEENKCR